MDNTNKTDYEKRLDSEIEKRLNAMESPDYAFPTRFGKRDYIIVSIVVVFSLIVLIIGAFL